MTSQPAQHSLMIRLIAAFKLFKGVLLLAAGLGALRLLHSDVAAVAERWLDAFRVDPENRHIHGLLSHLANVDEKKLREFSLGTFFYSAVLLCEGTGLWLGKRWAEYFTILATGSFIPLEIYELHRRLTLPRFTLLLLNVAIVIYLIWHLFQLLKDD
jgi:uncharacterized membrane protein (DUF2068 family)